MDAVSELKCAVAADVAADGALSAAQALGDEDVSAERLKGNAWVDMIRTAARFVQSIAVQDEGGGLALDGRCPLCWQEADEDAQARLQRFQQDEALIVQIEGLADRLRLLGANLNAQRRAIQVSLSSGDWQASPAVDVAALHELRGLCARVDAERAALPATDEVAAEQLAVLSKERGELASRKALAEALSWPVWRLRGLDRQCVSRVSSS